MTAIAETPGEIQVAPQSIFQRLLDAAKAIGVVEKDQRNRFHNYDYASIEGIVDAVHDALLDRGVLWLAGTEGYEDRQRTTREGEATVTTVQVLFTFIDVNTGERAELSWIGRGDDPAGQGLAKALTDARKTFIVQQLNLRRGDDPESDARPDQPDQSSGPTANLIADARGLSNEMLNRALVKHGLPAQQAPFGAFTRIPSEVAAEMSNTLAELHKQ